MKRNSILSFMATVLTLTIYFCMAGLTANAQNPSALTKDSPERQDLTIQLLALSDVIGTYDINGNGFTGVLIISSITSDGRIFGTVFGQSMFGFYDDTAKKIFFMRIINSSDLTSLQIYSGYLFTGPASTSLTFAGSFEVFSGTGGTAQRHVAGWTASKRP